MQPNVVYKAWDGATPESERRTLIAAYRYLIFECHASEKGARPGPPDDEKGTSSNDSLAKKHSTT
jgi:hypothetical protein